jgi:hypothetical protein
MPEIPIKKIYPKNHFCTKRFYPIYVDLRRCQGSTYVYVAPGRLPFLRSKWFFADVPVAKLMWITDEDEHHKKKWQLYHVAMSMILAPLRNAARTGVEMTCADGGVRCVHPILSRHLGDWPEHCTAGCTNNTRCPICVELFKGRGNLGPPERLRTKPETLRAIRFSERGYTGVCAMLGIRPVWPYWGDHPWSSGPSCIAPDLLHQLWKGMFLTHLRPWWTKLLGKTEMDERYMGVPRFSGHRHFSSGLSLLTQWTGNEARAAAKVFLPIIAGDMPHLAVRAARGIMDFLYQTRKPQLDEDDIAMLENDLGEFHDTKHIFRARKVHVSRYGFNGITKLHMLRHYPHQIREWGTPDGYSTEGLERLHIDLVKVPYRTTNGVNPEPQMILHLQRLEALSMRRAKLQRAGVLSEKRQRYVPAHEEPSNLTTADKDSDVEDGDKDVESRNVNIDNLNDAGDDVNGWVEGDNGVFTRVKEHSAYQPKPRIHIAKRPTHSNVLARTITTSHWAPGFVEAVCRYLEPLSANLAFHINGNVRFGIYSRFSLHHQPLPFSPLEGGKTDLVRASPAKRSSHGLVMRAAFFDTVFLEDWPNFEGLLRT